MNTWNIYNHMSSFRLQWFLQYEELVNILEYMYMNYLDNATFYVGSYIESYLANAVNEML